MQIFLSVRDLIAQEASEAELLHVGSLRAHRRRAHHGEWRHARDCVVWEPLAGHQARESSHHVEPLAVGPRRSHHANVDCGPAAILDHRDAEWNHRHAQVRFIDAHDT